MATKLLFVNTRADNRNIPPWKSTHFVRFRISVPATTSMLKSKGKHFKIALRPTKSRRVANSPLDLIAGASRFGTTQVALSHDQRRVISKLGTVLIPNEIETDDVDPETLLDWDDYGGHYSGGHSSAPRPVIVDTEKERICPVYEAPLKSWIPWGDKYMNDIIALEGPGSQSVLKCGVCDEDSSDMLRCRDCFGGHIFCVPCTLRVHHYHPLHRLERWTGSYFARTDLYSYGFKIQLGHNYGESCLHPKPADFSFTVIDTTGIHRVRVDFCECPRDEDLLFNRQLLQAGWWPGSLKRPKTCATLGVLRHFHKQTLQGKISAFDFYRGLELETDNTGLFYLPDRLASFMLIVHEYRHVKMMQRAGAAHREGGITAMTRGEAAVMCLSCPHPGINLPDGWEDAPKDKQWRYELKLVNDANFRLDNFLRSTVDNDPWLGNGSSYFVEEEPYNNWVLGHANEEEMTTCAGFAALLKANLTRTKGLRTTGVGATVCVHDCWRPNGIGDLQKGERYCNMDYIWLSTLKHSTNKKILSIYDIMCQWRINLFARTAKAPDFIRRPLDPADLRVAIPKFHLLAHGDPCQVRYSLNFMHGVGRVDGEGVERCWSVLNGISRSTRQMGPGSRKDTIEDHCGHSNWRKIVNKGLGSLRRMELALSMAVECQVSFEHLEACLRSIRPADVDKWEAILDTYAADPNAPNPYQVPRSDISLTTIRLRYATEEANTAAKDGTAAPEYGVSAFITAGFELEELQRNTTLNKLTGMTDYQSIYLQERLGSFHRKLAQYRVLRSIHMPGLVVQETLVSLNTVPVSQILLHLPSSIPEADRERVAPSATYTAEADLRYGQAMDALNELRRQLRTRTCTNRFRIKNITGQRASTQARTMQKGIDGRVKLAAAKYRSAHAAHLALIGPGEWEKTLRELRPDDVRALNERALTEQEKEDRRVLRRRAGLQNEGEFQIEETTTGGPGEGFRTLSWIWLQTSKDGEDDLAMHDALRVEYCKAKARALRFREDVELVREEMGRVVMGLHWWAERWRQRNSACQFLTAPTSQGAIAYAYRQAAMLDAMAARFASMWRDSRVQANEYLRSHDIPDHLELQVTRTQAEAETSVPEDRPGPDEDDEDLWGCQGAD